MKSMKEFMAKCDNCCTIWHFVFAQAHHENMKVTCAKCGEEIELVAELGE